MSDKVDQARRIVLQRLESLHSAGVRQLPAALPSPVEPSIFSSPRGRGESDQDGNSPPVRRPSPSLETSDTEVALSIAPSLEVLRQDVAGCSQCKELAQTRTQTVFGVGNPRARLCFLGEAPGADEDRLGEPFVGRAGQLLDRILEACTLRREEVYILNVLKCRPPGNRNPTPEEAQHCRGFLDQQLELIQPEFLCCLGAVAAQNLLQTSTPIGKLRGHLHNYHGIVVVCTYHPAYLLRNPSAKKPAWDDMKMLMGEMGVSL